MMMMIVMSRRMALHVQRRLLGTRSSSLRHVDAYYFGCRASSLRAFSTTTTTTTTTTTGSDATRTTSTQQQLQHARIVRTLFKQLLRWCQRTDPALPLATFVPPIQVTSRQQAEHERLQYVAQRMSDDDDENAKSNDDIMPMEKRKHATTTTTSSTTTTSPRFTANEVTILHRICQDLPPQCRFLMHNNNNLNATTTLIAPVYNTTDLANLFRCLFRLNSINIIMSENNTTTIENQKMQVDLAFEAMKNLNELTASRSFQNLLQQHEQHSVNNKAITIIKKKKFRVGQVVQHVHERWRGVIVGWQVTTKQQQQQQQQQPHTSSTSLTTKEYPTTPITATKTTDSLPIKYQVVLDATDFQLALERKRVPDILGGAAAAAAAAADNEAIPVTIANESELELVTEACLTRIRGPQIMSNYFDAYDTTTQTFVPNAVLAYQYPVDIAAAAAEEEQRTSRTRTSENTLSLIPSDEKKQQLCHNVIQGVKEFCQHLENVIEQELQMWVSDASIGGGEEPVLLTQISRRLNLLVTGRHLEQQAQRPQANRYKSRHTASPTDLAASYLHEFFLLSMEIFRVLWQRQKCLEYSDQVRFRIGDVVRHKQYNFRGVVVAWDPKPTVDVSLWDGLQGIANPTELPFYQVVPDPYDCIRAFGSERGLRYVCEENLEYCPADETDIVVDLDDPEWKRESNGEGGGYRYIPPPQLLFMYAQDDRHSDPDGILSRCMDQIEKEINEWQWHVATNTFPDDAPAFQLSLEDLIALGKICDTFEDARSVRDMIQLIRLANHHIHLRRKIMDGKAALSAGKALEALEIFSAVVEKDPTYTEAWHNRATCELILGQNDESLASAHKVLELDPGHAGGLAGMGLYYAERENNEAAIDYYRRSLAIDPWLPVASYLSSCLDHVSTTTHNDE